MTCKHCESLKIKTFHPIYDFACLGCCARLVASARPERGLQEAMFAAISIFKESPKREQIIEKLKGMKDSTK
jgi:hypothetical protein